MLVLSDGDVAELLDLDDLHEVVAEGFVKQETGEVERPERPHFDVGRGLDSPQPTGTGLVMPAYVHGRDYVVTKIVGVHADNAARDLSTVQARIAVDDARTGQPLAAMAGNRITNARTGCIGGLAVRELAPGSSLEVAVLGAGTQARWQARCVDAVADVDQLRVFSPSDSKHAYAREVEDRWGLDVRATKTAAQAVRGADVVVTATTSHDPVFPPSALEPPALVVAIGAYTPDMQEIPAPVVDDASPLVADVPDEVAAIGDLVESGRGVEDLVPLGTILQGDDRPSGELALVDSVGTAVLDAVVAEHLYERALDRGAGTRVPL